MVHHPDEVWVRYGFSTDIRRRRHQTDANQTPGRLYPARLKVVPAKLEDLQQIAAFAHFISLDVSRKTQHQFHRN